MTNIPTPPAQEKNHWAVPTAIVGSMLFVVVAVALFNIAQNKKLSETIWNRLALVYNSIASIGFACFGVLLGTTVQHVKLTEAKSESTKKGEAMRNAINVLQQQDSGVPQFQNFHDGRLSGDEQAAAANTRAREASQILLQGLS